jgi:hypothetical protein
MSSISFVGTNHMGLDRLISIDLRRKFYGLTSGMIVFSSSTDLQRFDAHQYTFLLSIKNNNHTSSEG